MFGKPHAQVRRGKYVNEHTPPAIPDIVASHEMGPHRSGAITAK